MDTSLRTPSAYLYPRDWGLGLRGRCPGSPQTAAPHAGHALAPPADGRSAPHCAQNLGGVETGIAGTGNLRTKTTRAPTSSLNPPASTTNTPTTMQAPGNTTTSQSPGKIVLTRTAMTTRTITPIVNTIPPIVTSFSSGTLEPPRRGREGRQR